VDILIIGAGASGAAVAWRLSDLGLRIVCLEQGRWHKPAEYSPAFADWEFRANTCFSFNPNVRGLPEDYPVEDSQSDVSPLMFNAVGGSTIHWTAHAPRFHPSDFRVKSQDGVADDWPLSYADLEPYYDLNDQWMGCSGIAGDPANPTRAPRPMPPLPLGPDGERLAKGFDALGWHWWPSDSYINSVPRHGRAACNNCGPNGLGCTVEAKGSTDITYWPAAIKNGVELRTGARVLEIITDPATGRATSRVTGARYRDASGTVHLQPARLVVLAANGIGTPRLLLLSKSERHPDGLANSSGLVGRNLMFHPVAAISGFFADDCGPTWRGPLGNILLSQEFYETDRARGFVRGYTFQMTRSTGPARTAMGASLPPVAWGAGHHAEFKSRFGNSTTVAALGEDLPEAHNRIELDPALTDSSGLPAPKVFYRLSKNSARMMAHACKQAETVLAKAGAHTVKATPLLRASGWHLMGTARMGSDPRTSVVDHSGRAHDADNLYVVVGSVFVTGASVNPTPTLQAIALRSADHIRKAYAELARHAS
jgi:choline dehydrogenase-like flavoprotein